MMTLHPVCPAAEIPPGSRKIVTLGKVEIGIFNVHGVYHAYRNLCPHAGAPVCQGRVGGTTLPSAVYEYEYGREGCILRCPWHGWEFDLETGEHLVDPATRLKKICVEIGPPCPAGAQESENLEKFPVKIEDGVIHLALSGKKPPLG